MTDAHTPPPLPPPATTAAAPASAEPAISPPPASAPLGRRPRVGQLTTAWQIMGAAAWASAFFAFAGVWKASEEIGIATWWLGPRADPQPIVIRVIPFTLALAMALWAVYNLRGFPWASLAGTAGVVAAAAFDISRSVGLALAEFAIAGALALVSLASIGGRYRAPDPSATASAVDAAVDTGDGDPFAAPPPDDPTDGPVASASHV